MVNSQIVELWTLYSLGVSFTILRTYARVKAVGIRDLRADDYLIWFAVLIYTVQCSLGYNLGAAAHGLANNGMTPEERSSLTHDNPEYAMRVLGSKIQVAGWTSAACLLWTLKFCVTFFYFRLMNGLEKFRMHIYIALGLIGSTFITLLLTIFISCRPFNHYWQINPDPGNVCQAAISIPIVWVMFVTNVVTDAYLVLIPIPMLWQSSLKLIKKLAATLVLSAGVLIIVCATLKSVFVLVDPEQGGQLAAAWGTRETFIAVITTNLPMVFPLLKVWFAPWLPTTNCSTSNKAYKVHGSGFVTIGGGGASASNRSRQAQSTRDVTGNMTFGDNESEEHIVRSSTDVNLQNLQASHGAQNSLEANKIMVSTHVSIKSEDASSDKIAKSFTGV
ncbi:hypothetical protein BU23DRAFT_523437 [Bimuria novae-zelandiae CBS 107.79]|uniref:Rhodopsin domain-containing protein n=1 Tax=Bimuria novae-zelandiae CBS 107.79 TaxID=1447943 RepID=A0A6A5VRI9_9PLEO|nr:hypothetical protein BU23DRAFT_523437 [Bimuria novae-zelandiae CBS 107.79]